MLKGLERKEELSKRYGCFYRVTVDQKDFKSYTVRKTPDDIEIVGAVYFLSVHHKDVGKRRVEVSWYCFNEKTFEENGPFKKFEQASCYLEFALGL